MSVAERDLRHSILATIEHLHDMLETARAGAAQKHREEARRNSAEAESVTPPVEMSATVETVMPGASQEQCDAGLDSPSEENVSVEAHPEDLTEESKGRPAPPFVVSPPSRSPPSKPRPKRLVKRPKPKTQERPTTAGAPVEPPRPITRPESSSPEQSPPEVSITPVFDTHAFSDGWCTRCGISTTAARDNGYACNPMDPTRVRAERKPTGPSGTHRFDGNWCIRCGLSREQASTFTCND
jgi:hypothetical protein